MKEKEKQPDDKVLSKLTPEEVEYSEHLRRRMLLPLIRDSLQRPQNWMARLKLEKPDQDPKDVYEELKGIQEELEEKETKYLEGTLVTEKEYKYYKYKEEGVKKIDPDLQYLPLTLPYALALG